MLPATKFQMHISYWEAFSGKQRGQTATYKRREVIQGSDPWHPDLGLITERWRDIHHMMWWGGGHCFQWHTWTLNLLAVEEDWQPPCLGTVKPILNVVGMPYPTHRSHRADRSDSLLLWVQLEGRCKLEPSSKSGIVLFLFLSVLSFFIDLQMSWF